MMFGKSKSGSDSSTRSLSFSRASRIVALKWLNLSQCSRRSVKQKSKYLIIFTNSANLFDDRLCNNFILHLIDSANFRGQR